MSPLRPRPAPPRGRLPLARRPIGILITCALLLAATRTGAAPPVLLVYGFQPIPGFRAAAVWELFAEGLSGGRVAAARTIEIEPGHTILSLPAADAGFRDVFLSDYALAYEPTLRDLRFYARRLADEIEWITSALAVPKVDVVAHSMGALVARAYVECADFEPVIGSADFPDYRTAYRGDVGTLIGLAAPHHGASLVSFGQWLSRLGRQLSPGGEFLALLNADRLVENRLASLQPGVRYVSMAGQTCLGCKLRVDEEACLRECVAAGLAWQGSDLVVLMASAYLPEAENVACIGMNHVDMHSHPTVLASIQAILDGAPAPPVLYGSPELRLDLREAIP